MQTDLGLDLVYFIDLNAELDFTEYRDLQADFILIFRCNNSPDGTGRGVINSNNGYRKVKGSKQ